MASTQGPAILLCILLVDVVCSASFVDPKQAIWKNLISQRWLRRNNSAIPIEFKSLSLQDGASPEVPSSSNQTGESEALMTSFTAMTLGVTLVQQLMQKLTEDMERIEGQRPRPPKLSLPWSLPVEDGTNDACRQRAACEAETQTDVVKSTSTTSSLASDANRIPRRWINGLRLPSGRRRVRSPKTNNSCLKFYPKCPSEKYSIYLLNAYFDNVVSSSNALESNDKVS